MQVRAFERYLIPLSLATGASLMQYEQNPHTLCYWTVHTPNTTAADDLFSGVFSEFQKLAYGLQISFETSPGIPSRRFT